MSVLVFVWSPNPLYFKRNELADYLNQRDSKRCGFL